MSGRPGATLGVVQARMASGRLPGKALALLGGEPMVVRIVRRLQQVESVSQTVLATTTEASDDELVQVCDAHDIATYRGPVDDIASRLVGAARAHGADVLVRVWGDCPFVDPAVVERAVAMLHDNDLDYVTNGLDGVRTFPPGLDVEVYRTAVLESLVGEPDAALREFPVEYATRGNARWGLLQRRSGASDRHITVDYPEDLRAARRLIQVLDDRKGGDGLDALLTALEAHPDLAAALESRPRNIEYRALLATEAHRSRRHPPYVTEVM